MIVPMLTICRCILCQDRMCELAWEENGHGALRCVACGLIQVCPLPPPESVRAIYEHDAAQTASRQLLAKARAPHALAHARHLLSLLAPFRPGGRLLELGPGGGLFLREAAAAGYTVTGLEPNPVQAAFIQQELGLTCVQASLGEALLQERFDVVVHVNVLSHLRDPLASLSALRALLVDDGIMLLETGNFGDVDHRWYPLIAATERFQLPDHLFFFGEAALCTLLSRAGFEVLAVFRYSRVPEKRLPPLLRALGLRRLAERLRFFWTYRLGALAPKRGRPQTLIVLARRAALPSE